MGTSSFMSTALALDGFCLLEQSFTPARARHSRILRLLHGTKVENRLRYTRRRDGNCLTVSFVVIHCFSLCFSTLNAHMFKTSNNTTSTMCAVPCVKMQRYLSYTTLDGGSSRIHSSVASIHSSEFIRNQQATPGKNDSLFLIFLRTNFKNQNN